LITADQLVAHAVGDYILQSDWMANEKTKRSLAAAAHALTYALPFLLLRPSIAAFAFIAGTHFLVDRWRLARFVCYAKNFLAPQFTWAADGKTPTALWWFKWEPRYWLQPRSARVAIDVAAHYRGQHTARDL